MSDSRAPTHPAGSHGRSTFYEQAVLAERRKSAERPALSSLQITALYVLPVALVPWTAEKVVGLIIADPLVSFSLKAGFWLSFAVAGAAVWQLASKSERLPRVRQWLLILFAGGIATSSVFAAGAAVRSWSSAEVGPPQRAFEFYERCGKRCGRLVYQSGDGRIIGKGEVRPLPPHGSSCVSVREVVGEYGLRWARVVERSRDSKRGQLHWPVRSEECFSDLPVSTLPR